MCDLANRQMRHQALCKTASNHPANPPWIWRVLHCINLGNTWKPPVLMTQTLWLLPEHSEGDDQSFGSSVPVVSRCFPGLCNVKLVISRGRLAGRLLAVLHSGGTHKVGCFLSAWWLHMITFNFPFVDGNGMIFTMEQQNKYCLFLCQISRFYRKITCHKFVWYESEISVFW